ncbi:MAG TPA: Slp family lipoprotein [Burkholderiales bacterium]|nr:Slp family lipoprotein [Burkholderiales bacterium]
MLASCASVPARLSGGAFAQVTPRMAQNQDLVGRRVRWGGAIAKVFSGRQETCFEVVSHPLDSSARPEDIDQSDGRFLACSAGFYDPAVYASGREITVIGTLEIPQLGKIGEYEYRFPRVSASEVYLWPKKEVYYYPYPPYDPFWYPPGPWMMGPW